jgi:hypothetical protein
VECHLVSHLVPLRNYQHHEQQGLVKQRYANWYVACMRVPNTFPGLWGGLPRTTRSFLLGEQIQIVRTNRTIESEQWKMSCISPTYCNHVQLCLQFNDKTGTRLMTFLHHRINWWGHVAIHVALHSLLLLNLSETFLILKRIQRDIIINVHRSSCKVPVILVRF